MNCRELLRHDGVIDLDAFVFLTFTTGKSLPPCRPRGPLHGVTVSRARRMLRETPAQPSLLQREECLATVGSLGNPQRIFRRARDSRKAVLVAAYSSLCKGRLGGIPRWRHIVMPRKSTTSCPFLNTTAAATSRPATMRAMPPACWSASAHQLDSAYSRRGTMHTRALHPAAS